MLYYGKKLCGSTTKHVLQIYTIVLYEISILNFQPIRIFFNQSDPFLIKKGKDKKKRIFKCFWCLKSDVLMLFLFLAVYVFP